MGIREIARNLHSPIRKRSSIMAVTRQFTGANVAEPPPCKQGLLFPALRKWIGHLSQLARNNTLMIRKPGTAFTFDIFLRVPMAPTAHHEKS